MLHTCSRAQSTASWPINRRSIGAGQRGSWGVVLCRTGPLLLSSVFLLAVSNVEKHFLLFFVLYIILQHWLTKFAKIWKIHFKWWFGFIFHLLPVLSVWQHRGLSRNNEATIVTQHFNAMEYTNVTIVRLEIFDHNQSLVLLHMLLLATTFFLMIRLVSSSTTQQWYIFYSLYMKVEQCHQSHVYPLFLLCAVLLKGPAQTPGVDYRPIGITWLRGSL